MNIEDVIKAIDVARVEGRALVLMKVPPGMIALRGADGAHAQVSCVSIARGLCSEIERKLPGAAAIPVPMGFDVDVRGAGGA